MPAHEQSQPQPQPQRWGWSRVRAQLPGAAMGALFAGLSAYVVQDIYLDRKAAMNEAATVTRIEADLAALMSTRAQGLAAIEQINQLRADVAALRAQLDLIQQLMPVTMTGPDPSDFDHR